MNKVLDRLMADLSLRENNVHAGSGLGGNPSEFFFLLTHNVAVAHPTNTTTVSFKERDGVILMLCPANITMRQLRRDFSDFYNQHADKKDVTFKQLADISYLKDLRNSSLNIRLLMKCVSMTTKLMSSLKEKDRINSAICKFFEQEYNRLRKDLENHLGWTMPDYPEMDSTYEAALNDNKCTEDQLIERDVFRDPDGPERTIFNSILESFPDFKARSVDIFKRRDAALALIYSPDELKLFDDIVSFPKSIAMFSIRTLIGIDMIIKLNLDDKLASLRIEDDHD